MFHAIRQSASDSTDSRIDNKVDCWLRYLLYLVIACKGSKALEVVFTVAAEEDFYRRPLTCEVRTFGFTNERGDNW